MPDVAGDARVRRWPYLVAALAALVAGALVAVGVNGALGLTSAPSAVPVENLRAAPRADAVAAPKLDAVSLPSAASTASAGSTASTGSADAALQRKRLTLAAESVASALAGRGLPEPRIGTDAPGDAALTVTIVESLPGAAAGSADEAFRLRRHGDGLSLDAVSAAGAANGLYAVADRIRSGTAVLPAAQDGRVVAPRLPLRLTDHGAVGLEADRAAFAKGTDYGLNTDAVGTALLDRAPWVDAAAVQRIGAQFRQFVDHALAYGYNGVVVPGFLEYVTFSGVGDGHAVYHAGDSHIARAQAMRAAFGPVWRYAHDMGMKVFFQTDMLALSPPLKRYLGEIDTSSARLWSVYRSGLHELFTALPYADGVMIRIGEGGGDYKLAGWDYRSEIKVTTVPQVRAMLTALLAQADADGRDVIFRTWSVGVGAVGDMHTNPASYHKVLDGIDDDHLIVSTKYSLGDFYSGLPFNTTLATGTQRRIVEFQSRREFEGFGALPNDLGDLEQRALTTLLAANPHIVGVWDWTQDGGPMRAGPMTLYLRTGFWQMWDVNVYVTARLAWDPEADTAAATRDWIRQTFSSDPATVSAIAQVMASSRRAVKDGLYIGPYADHRVKALGLEPPPMMWIFEWDIVTGDGAALDTIYRVARPRIDEAIAEGRDAVALARRMKALVDATPASSWRDPGLRRQFADALAYEVDLFTTLSSYRTMTLRHVQWLDTGSASSKARWKAAEKRFRADVRTHRQRYGGNVALPAYNFTAAKMGMHRADRDIAMAWLARAMLLALAVAFALGTSPGQRLLRGAPGSAALRALWLGMTRPWRIGAAGPPQGRTDRLLIWLLPTTVLVLSRAAYTWFAAPAHLVLTLGAWAVFAVALRCLARGRDRFALAAAVGGAALLRTAILLLALAGRGPGRYWYDFWTAPALRSFYITVAFAAFLWVLAVALLTARTAGGLPRRRATGMTLISAGAPVAVLGGLVATIGLEHALTIWNDQMALLPWGLSRILGITTYLGIPTDLPLIATAFGIVLAAAGAALTFPWTRRTAAGPGDPS